MIAILLGSETKGHDVMKVADRTLKALDGNKTKLGVKELQKIEGVGMANEL